MSILVVAAGALAVVAATDERNSPCTTQLRAVGRRRSFVSKQVAHANRPLRSAGAALMSLTLPKASIYAYTDRGAP
jgi:hypothetical protein